MTRLKSLERRTMIFAGLLVVLTLVLFLQPSRTTTVASTDLPLVFPDFPKAEARRIELSKPLAEDGAKKLTLDLKQGGNWVLASNSNYPATAGRAERLLDAIASARRRSVVTRRQDTFEKYAGTDGWTEVSVQDGRGRPLAEFGIGRYERYPDIFLRVQMDGEPRIIKAVHLTTDLARIDSSSWIETRMWPELTASNVIRVDLEQVQDDRTIVLARRGESPADVELDVPEKGEGEDDIWWMTKPEEADAKKLEVEDLTRSFTGMLIEDVVAGSLTDETRKEYGFDTPELVVTIFHKEGEKVGKYTLTVGGKIGEDGASSYAQRKGATWVFKIRGGNSLSRFRQEPAEFRPAPEKKDEGEADGEAKEDGAAKDAEGGSAAKDAKKEEEKTGDAAPKSDDGKKPGDPEPKKDDGKKPEDPGDPDGGK